MSVLNDVFQGTGSGIAVLIAGWIYAGTRRRKAMKAAEIDTSQAKDKADRELLETIYSVLITAEPTPLNPHPTPGLMERVENIEHRVLRDEE